MIRRIAASGVMSVILWAGSAVAAPPYLAPADVYRYDLKTMDRDFDQHEDALRHSYKTQRQMEEDAWRQARRSAPPQARKSLNQQYVQRKKELAREYVAQRKALDQLEDRSRAAMKEAYRHGPRYYVYPPPQFDDSDRYEPRYNPPQRFEDLPPPPQSAPSPFNREI